MAIRSRKGSAGDDVTSTEQFVEEVVVADEDQSYEVEGTDSPEETVQEATVITDEHEVVNPIEDGEIVDEEIEETREGRRGRRVTRKGSRRGSRKGATMVDGKSPMEYLKMLEELQGFPEEREIIASGDEDAAEEYLKKDAQLNNQTYEEAVRSIAEEYNDDSYLGGRKGSRKGSRKGIAYGGKSEVHQESIKAAVAVAMRDRRL